MKSLKRVAALVLAVLFVGCGVLSSVGTVKVDAAAAKISAKKKTIKQGEKFTLSIKGGKGTIKWSVNNDNVSITKKTGKKTVVKGVKAGTSKVTANVKGKKLTCTVKVNGLNIVKKELTVGQKFTLKAVGLGKKIKWSASGAVTVKGSKEKATVTATKEGSGTVTAKVGKKSYKCAVTVKHVHKEVTIPGKAATCTTPGLSDGKKCSVCNQVTVAQKETALAAHTLVHFEAITPACHYNGRVEYWFCSVCEGFWTDADCKRVTNSKSVILPATGSENLQHVEAKAPTATENGNVEYWYCPDCEQFWLDAALTRLTNAKSVVVPATGEPVEGSEENPAVLPLEGSETGATATVTVPAGATVWYQGRVSGMNLEAYAEGNDVFSVIHNGETYESWSDYMDGQVLTDVALEGMRMATFAIVNTSDADKTFTLTFAYPIGTMMNPDTAWDLSSLWVTLPADSQGYYYKYTPEADETVQLMIQDIYCDVEGAQADFVVTVTDPVTYVSVTKSYLADAVDGVLTVDMKAGAEVMIQVVMVPDQNWVVPAADVVIGMPKGTVANPDILYDMEGKYTVGAGSEYYLAVYSAAGNTLVISGGDAIVTIDGTEYTAVNGVVSVDIPVDPMAMGRQPAVNVVIKNTTSAALEYTVKIVMPEGSVDNPEQVEAGTQTVELAADSQGYYYTYIAETTGTLEITVDSTVGWFYTVNNLTTYEYGENQFCGDPEASNVYTIDVTAGDEIQIFVNTADATNQWAAPAGTITLDIAYASDSNMDVEEDKDDSYGGIF